MTIKRVILAAAVLTVFGALAAAPVRGETFDKRTVFSFNRPISVPGVTLPAGDYMFRIVDTDTGRKVIQVLSGDGRTPYAMLHSIPDIRVEASANPEVRFMETAKGKPSAVKTWWYPHERIGYEFIYPKDQARKLAEETHEPVLTTQVETTKVEETRTAELARIEPAGIETPVPVVAEPEPIVPAGVVQEGTLADARTELPVTATGIPTLGLLGALALGFAAGLRVWRLGRA